MRTRVAARYVTRITGIQIWGTPKNPVAPTRLGSSNFSTHATGFLPLRVRRKSKFLRCLTAISIEIIDEQTLAPARLSSHKWLKSRADIAYTLHHAANTMRLVQSQQSDICALLRQRRERLAFFNNVGRKHFCLRLADIFGGVDRAGRNEIHVPRF